MIEAEWMGRGGTAAAHAPEDILDWMVRGQQGREDRQKHQQQDYGHPADGDTVGAKAAPGLAPLGAAGGLCDELDVCPGSCRGGHLWNRVSANYPIRIRGSMMA